MKFLRPRVVLLLAIACLLVALASDEMPRLLIVGLAGLALLLVWALWLWLKGPRAVAWVTGGLVLAAFITAATLFIHTGRPAPHLPSVPDGKIYNCPLMARSAGLPQEAGLPFNAVGAQYRGCGLAVVVMWQYLLADYAVWAAALLLSRYFWPHLLRRRASMRAQAG
jgi:energy-coupling factor transporter transmembrane protein EcfT